MSSKTNKIGLKALLKNYENQIKWVELYLHKRNLKKDFEAFVQEEVNERQSNNNNTSTQPN